MEEDKVFFKPGDLVTIKQDVPNKPIMLVIDKDTCTFRIDPVTGDKKSNKYFRGIKCRWFTTNGFLQEAVWNTKDIVKY